MSLSPSPCPSSPRPSSQAPFQASSPPPFQLSGIVARLRSSGCVFAEDEAELLLSEARTPAQLSAMVDLRAAGSPLEHVVGWAEFCGLRITVDPGVFVPRRRTEWLVRQAVALTSPRKTAPTVIVDLCCGSGALSAALAAELGQIEVHAVDIDPAAVRCARRNLATTGGRVYEGDLYKALPTDLQGRVDLLVASPPYVPTDSIGLLPPEARLHEPRVALDGGADGLDVVRRVAAEAPLWLAPGGRLLIETSMRQAAQTVDVIAVTGLVPQPAHCEDWDATAIVGNKPAVALQP